MGRARYPRRSGTVTRGKGDEGANCQAENRHLRLFVQKPFGIREQISTGRKRVKQCPSIGDTRPTHIFHRLDCLVGAGNVLGNGDWGRGDSWTRPLVDTEKESLMIRRLVNSIKQSAGANWAASFIPLSGLYNGLVARPRLSSPLRSQPQPVASVARLRG